VPEPQDPSKPLPPGFAHTVIAARFAANILACLCIYDAVREGLGAYQYHTTIPLLSLYKAVLGTYSVAQQGNLWRDPDAKPSSWGSIFILLWLAVPVILNALEYCRLGIPIQPADLNSTLNWVIGYYVFGKASTLARINGLRPMGLGKTLDARRAAKGLLAPPAPLPQEKLKIMAELRLAVDVLGAVCLMDVLREGVFPPYQSVIDIHFAYRLALAAFAGTNRWRKWTRDSQRNSLGLSGPGDCRPLVDPEADSSRSGAAWVLAWVGMAVLLWLLSAGNIVVLPERLMGTATWVISIYLLGKAPDIWEWNPLRPRPGQVDPPGPGKPVHPTPPAPKHDDPQPPAAPAEGGQTPPDAASDLDADLETVAAACQEAGEFSRADIVRAANLSADKVKRRLDELLHRGWIERIKFGRYRWKGRYFWKDRRGRG
jgi:hypothetical protein